MESLLCQFPKDIILEIMSWIPADSLLGFKRVNKYWHTLISELLNDTSFVAKHLNNTKKLPQTSLVFSHDETFALITISTANNGSDHFNSITEELDLPPPRHESTLGRWQCGYHCDGIICLVHDTNKLVLCNPMLREIRIIPELGSVNCHGMGFGYDYSAKDYKLVRIFLDETDRAEVYTLGTDSWKVIDMPEGLNVAEILYKEALCWRGVCYWLVNNMEGHSAILWFNMYDEEFDMMKLPELVNTKLVMDDAELTVWNNSIAFFVCHRDYEFDEFPLFVEMFVFDGYSSEDKCASWTKQVFAGPFEDISNALFSFVDKDELLMQDVYKRLVTYNVHTEKLRDVIVQDLDRLQRWFCFYTKSLVSVRKK